MTRVLRARLRQFACLLAMMPGAALAAAAPAPTEVPPSSMRHYALLEQAQQRYQELARHPGLTQLPPLPARTLRPGDAYQGMAALRRLLQAVGDLPPASTTQDALPDVLDAPTSAALGRFQERHGLAQDGVLGPATWRALTTPLAARLRQIELTLARWRSLPANPHQRAIFINIPRFRLYAMSAGDDSEARMLQMDVVVGKVLRELHTPVFTADLTHLIFAPYWDVPPSIVRAEVIPAVRRDPAYLTRNHFELLDRTGRIVPVTQPQLDALARGELRLRQRPGSDNALGAVKFMLPNPHDVYLHDTPARELFAQRARAFSHGCIRVSRPAALAQWLLDDAAWSADAVAAAMRRTEPLQVNLAEPVRVYIVYGTAVAREDGSVLFLDDLYGLDRD